MRLTSRAALRIFDIADVWATRTGNTVRLVSANDHVHVSHSAHYEGLAVDLHSSNLDALAATLKRIGYRVLWKVPGHFTHVHVEDPRAASRAALEASRVTRVIVRAANSAEKASGKTKVMATAENVAGPAAAQPVEGAVDTWPGGTAGNGAP